MTMSNYLHRKREMARAHGITVLGKLRLNYRTKQGPRGRQAKGEKK